MVNVDLYSAIIRKVSNALNTLVSGEKPGFQTLSKGLVVLLCAEVVRQGVPDHGAVYSECSASNSAYEGQAVSTEHMGRLTTCGIIPPRGSRDHVCQFADTDLRLAADRNSVRRDTGRYEAYMSNGRLTILATCSLRKHLSTALSPSGLQTTLPPRISEAPHAQFVKRSPTFAVIR